MMEDRLAPSRNADFERLKSINILLEDIAQVVRKMGPKSAVDHEALLPVRLREAELRKAYGADRLDYDNAKTAWEKAREAAVKAAKGDRDRIKRVLDALFAKWEHESHALIRVFLSQRHLE